MKTPIAPAPTHLSPIRKALTRILILAFAALMLPGCASTGSVQARHSESRDGNAVRSWQDATRLQNVQGIALVSLRF